MKIRLLATFFFLTSTLLVIQAQDVILNENIDADVFQQSSISSDSVLHDARKLDAIQNYPVKQFEWIYVGSNDDTTQIKRNYRYKYPVLACGLSLLWPGLGQIYNGQYLKGAIMFVICPVSFIGCIAAGYLESSYNENLYALYGLLLISNYIWSLIDAPVSANKINQRNQALSWNLGNDSKLSIIPNVLTANQIGKKIIYHSPAYGLSMSLIF